MSIWISSGGPLRIWTALALLSTLPGCTADMAGVAGSRALSVSGGAVTVAGPAGYCVDKGASKDGSAGAFVLLGTCAAMTRSTGAGPTVAPAILTASVIPGAPDEGPLSAVFPSTARFFRSAPGRKALSRNGRPENVEVADVISKGEVLYIRLRDTSESAGQSVEPEYWRAILSLRGRIVTLSALALRDRPLTSSAKRKVLEAFVARMQATNT